MKRILLVGYDPETADFSDPALPPGVTAEKIRAGIAVALERFAERGWVADVRYIRPDETAGPTVEGHLASVSYDCVVIGAGVRLPSQGLAVFEAVINAVHKAAPGAVITFNTRPEDSADAAARWLLREGEARSSSSALSPTDPVPPKSVSCSFCGKPLQEVRKMITGPQVVICDECVRLCVNILDDEEHLQLGRAQRPPSVN